MKAVIYVRPYSLAEPFSVQLAKLHKAAADRGFTVSGEYLETFGGVKTLDQLLDDARSSRFDCLFVRSLDRIARSTMSQLDGLLRELERLGVRVVSIRENFDSGGALTSHKVLTTSTREGLEARIWDGMKLGLPGLTLDDIPGFD